jgi:hypothetical protein
MNGIYIEYAKLKQHHIEWLDNCGAKWASGCDFRDYSIHSECLSYGEEGVMEASLEYFKNLFERYTHCQTADEFCKGVAERLGIEYLRERHDTPEMEKRTKEYFQKKLDDKLAEHARADAGFPDTKEKVKYKHITDQLPDTRKGIKEEEKYKHLREYLIQTNTPGAFDITNAYCEELIRAVLKDLPQEWIRMNPDGRLEFAGGAINQNKPGEYYQRIGDISEKIQIIRNGFV